MQENKPQPEVIRLLDGTEATVLVANLQEGENLSIVNTEVLKEILSYMPSAKFSEIKEWMHNKIDNTINMEQYLRILQSELQFHKSVNMMQEFLFKKEETHVPKN